MLSTLRINIFRYIRRKFNVSLMHFSTRFNEYLKEYACNE
ncbi:hypothetical protein HMPREF9555_02243 [Selenomonas artemidis F0399]|uniref:Uncharacterized protein n=1 Tax=Selenomonas artemidis F0399 TaxID=749551 RepID=E7N5E8_9FIRM|nr:hypothetical protein HMPREF9555_02243 [Selenomonas artemidis F0399]EJP28897.1 hypothetical protein HMPREF1147_1153 [Selenomonas sp. FOBRC9]